eukprot:TRINITY_DN1526_c0_g1_i1.p1 TRINITY_DN1526_c0_g1~~TRINITY_DN1526_c0_g1_i1.p1  ORF type:complete len:167 (+),score=15.17 TRINITY_DN1526_c0_g1_i1:89-589(+)
MSALIDMSGDVAFDEDLDDPQNARSPGPRSHLRSVEALQANLRVVRHFFAKQVGQTDKSTISKPRIIAVYPYGLKFVTEPPEEQFEPEHIADLFDNAFLFKFVEISKFRFDAGKSEFAFTYVKPSTAVEPSITTEFVFRSFSVRFATPRTDSPRHDSRTPLIFYRC